MLEHSQILRNTVSTMKIETKRLIKGNFNEWRSYCPETGKLVVKIGQEEDFFTILSMDGQSIDKFKTQESAELFCNGMGWIIGS